MQIEEFYKLNSRFNQFFESYELLKQNQHTINLDKNLTFTDVQTIVLISENAPISMVDVARIQGVSRSAITQLVKRLNKKELVKIEFINGNNKNKFLIPTTKGIEVYKIHQRQQKYIENSIFDIVKKFKSRDIEMLNKLMDEIECVWNDLPWKMEE